MNLLTDHYGQYDFLNSLIEYGIYVIEKNCRMKCYARNYSKRSESLMEIMDGRNLRWKSRMLEISDGNLGWSNSLMEIDVCRILWWKSMSVEFSDGNRCLSKSLMEIVRVHVPPENPMQCFFFFQIHK